MTNAVRCDILQEQVERQINQEYLQGTQAAIQKHGGLIGVHCVVKKMLKCVALIVKPLGRLPCHYSVKQQMVVGLERAALLRKQTRIADAVSALLQAASQKRFRATN